MATRFANARALAKAQILKNGVSATYRQKGGTLINALEPWLGTTGDVDTVAPMVFLNFSRKEIAQGLVQDGDQKVLVAADDILGITPRTSDTIINAGRTLSIVSFQSIRPNNELVLHIFQVRD